MFSLCCGMHVMLFFVVSLCVLSCKACARCTTCKCTNGGAKKYKTCQRSGVVGPEKAAADPVGLDTKEKESPQAASKCLCKRVRFFLVNAWFSRTNGTKTLSSEMGSYKRCASKHHFMNSGVRPSVL